MTNRLYPGFLRRRPSLHFMLKVREFIEMVSGNDTTESDVLGQGTMQDNTTETRTTPSRGTAINSTSAPNSLTFEENNISTTGSRSNIPGSIQMSSEGMDDTMMDSQAEGHVSSSPISSSTVPNGSSASNSSSSNSSRSGDATNQSVEQIGGNPVRSSNVTGGSPLSNLRQISSNQNQEEQMQTATDSNATFSNLSTVGNMTQRNSSSASVQNRSANSERARESITDDEELPLENPLQRESSSEGVFEVDENQMEVDLQSSSSSTNASVPAAQASSSQQMSNDNAQHQNGYRNIENGSIQAEGSNTNSRSVMNGNLNTNSSHNDITSTPEHDASQQRSLSVVSNPERFNRLIVFGRQLQAMLQELETSQGIKTDKNTKMLQDAFALLAYPNPWDSPVGWQLEATEREFVSSSLNSAILESQCNQPGRPPLQVSLTHAKQLVKLMANNDLGACAFADVDDFLK